MLGKSRRLAFALLLMGSLAFAACGGNDSSSNEDGESASTSGGSVDAEGLTLTLEKGGRSRLAGNVNGGGPLLKLRTSGGNIEVRTR